MEQGVMYFTKSCIYLSLCNRISITGSKGDTHDVKSRNSDR